MGLFGQALQNTCETIITMDKPKDSDDKPKTGKDALATKKQQLQLKKSVIESLLKQGEEKSSGEEVDAQIYT